jgi:hypothetical protein
MTGNHHNRTVFTVTNPNEQPFKLMLKGRNAWAMQQLIDAGSAGCTPVKRPAPRWSAYIHNLRKFGVSIRTITERHGGDFAGNHGRYVLIAEVAIIIGGAM